MALFNVQFKKTPSVRFQLSLSDQDIDKLQEFELGNSESLSTSIEKMWIYIRLKSFPQYHPIMSKIALGALINNNLIDKETAECTLEQLSEQRSLFKIMNIIGEDTQSRMEFEKKITNIICRMNLKGVAMVHQEIQKYLDAIANGTPSLDVNLMTRLLTLSEKTGKESLIKRFQLIK